MKLKFTIKSQLPAEGEDGAKELHPSSHLVGQQLITDGDDGLSSDVEILTIHAAETVIIFFIKITTEAAVDLSDSTLEYSMMM